MKSAPTLRLIVPFMLFFTAVMAAQTSTQKSGPSLRETEAWIHDTLPDGTYREFKSPDNPRNL
jgi:hypothetical protein